MVGVVCAAAPVLEPGGNWRERVLMSHACRLTSDDREGGRKRERERGREKEGGREKKRQQGEGGIWFLLFRDCSVRRSARCKSGISHCGF